MSISFDDLETPTRLLRDEKPEQVDVPARPGAPATPLHADLGRRPPRRAAAHVRGPDAGRPRRPRAAGRARRGRHGVLALRRATPLQGRAQRGGRSPDRGAQLRAEPGSTRCGEARGTSTPASHDMDLNGVYASLNFPSSLARLRRPALPARRERPRLALAVVRAANDWHLEEWAGTPSRDASSRASCRGCSTPSVAAAEIRRNAERGLQGGHVPRAARAARPAVAAHRLLGPVHGRVRGDRDGRLPPRRVVVDARR